MNAELDNDLRISAARQQGWREVQWTYDDMYGGIYLGGINPQTNAWEEVPKSVAVPDKEGDDHDA